MNTRISQKSKFYLFEIRIFEKIMLITVLNPFIIILLVNICKTFFLLFFLLSLFLTDHATSCESERSFSFLEHLKSCLRLTMNQTHLCSLKLLHTHSEKLKEFMTNTLDSFIFGSNPKRKKKIFNFLLYLLNNTCHK